MTVLSLLGLLPSVVSGGMVAHLVWPDRDTGSIFLKFFLGIGLGLGLNSLVFFVYLNLFNRHPGYLLVQISLAIGLSVLVTIREKAALSIPRLSLKMNAVHVIGLIVTTAFLVLAGIIYVNVSMRKPHGAWDSWMIYNRAARMIFRAQTAWQDAFSPELYWYFHTDYPPQLALNVAAGWDAIGTDTVRVPMVLSGAFLFGSLGLAFTGVHAVKSFSQASLATIVLIGTSAYAEIGSKQLADIPLAFFILGTGALVLVYALKEHRGLLILAGLASGLAAWTKNEGIAFALASLVALVLGFRSRLRETLPWFALGFALPMAVLVYFKVAIAPPGDLFNNLAAQMQQALDPNRHLEILSQLRVDLASLNHWMLLAIYALIAGIALPGKSSSAYTACLIMIFLQLIGYYSVFLVSPHDLSWHLASLYRLLLQVQPLLVLLFFTLVRTPEAVLLEKDHATDD